MFQSMFQTLNALPPGSALMFKSSVVGKKTDPDTTLYIVLGYIYRYIMIS